jgi:hypothetical protein
VADQYEQNSEELMNGDLDPEYETEEEAEFDPEHEDVIRAKWSMDGAKTLSEAAARLRGHAEALERLEREGWQLTQPVEDDYGFIHRE